MPCSRTRAGPEPQRRNARRYPWMVTCSTSGPPAGPVVDSASVGTGLSIALLPGPGGPPADLTTCRRAGRQGRERRLTTPGSCEPVRPSGARTPGTLTTSPNGPEPVSPSGARHPDR